MFFLWFIDSIANFVENRVYSDWKSLESFVIFEIDYSNLGRESRSVCNRCTVADINLTTTMNIFHDGSIIASELRTSSCYYLDSYRRVIWMTGGEVSLIVGINMSPKPVHATFQSRTSQPIRFSSKSVIFHFVPFGFVRQSKRDG